MLVNMQEVNFGEAVILSQGNEKLLVDCGAKFEQKGLTAARSVLALLSGTTPKAVISHFDEDHYNGFIELAGKVVFDKIYLPLYIYNKRKNPHLIETNEMIDDMIKVWAYHKILCHGTKLDTLHKFFMSLPGLVKSRRDVICIGKGDSFYLEKKKFDVFWPEQYIKYRRTDYSTEIENLLKKYSVEGLESMTISINNYVNAFWNVYRIYALQEYEYSFEEAMLQLRNQYERLDSIIININLLEEDKRRFSSILNTKIRNMNNSSVVIGSGSDILMLGDVGKGIYKREIVPCIYPEYKVVKVSHHGTRPYYSDRLPQAESYLVSNSYTKRIGWSIYSEYGRKYEDKMHCTNTNLSGCGYIPKKCKNCNIGKGIGDISIDIDLL